MLAHLPAHTQVCSICQSALVNPVTTASCKHTFCRDCITRALAHSPTCPIDRSALALSSLVDTEPLVQLMLDELKVRCEAPGCSKVMERGLLLAHLRTCSQAIVTCGDTECGLSVSSLSVTEGTRARPGLPWPPSPQDHAHPPS